MRLPERVVQHFIPFVIKLCFSCSFTTGLLFSFLTGLFGSFAACLFGGFLTRFLGGFLTGFFSSFPACFLFGFMTSLHSSKLSGHSGFIKFLPSSDGFCLFLSFSRRLSDRSYDDVHKCQNVNKKIKYTEPFNSRIGIFLFFEDTYRLLCSCLRRIHGIITEQDICLPVPFFLIPVQFVKILFEHTGMAAVRNSVYIVFKQNSLRLEKDPGLCDRSFCCGRAVCRCTRFPNGLDDRKLRLRFGERGLAVYQQINQSSDERKMNY